MTTEQRNAVFDRLEKEGVIMPVQVSGIRFPLYMPGEDLPLLESVIAGQVSVKPRLEFLAPLDPMLWDRKLIEALWDYRYSWEIYTPASKRKYGYYVLPMIYGPELIGRIEAAADRKNRQMIVKNIWYESGVRRTKKLSHAVDSAIRRLARFNDCDQVTGTAE